MDSIEQYYKTRSKLYTTCALLLTWDFFGKHDAEFPFLGLQIISSNAIPFLLSIVVLFLSYFFTMHWKMITKPRNRLSIFDHYFTLLISLLSLLINLSYQVPHSNSAGFLQKILPLEITIIIGLVFLIVFYFLKSFLEVNRRENIVVHCLVWLLLLVAIGNLIKTIYSLKGENKLTTFETGYFFSSLFIITFFFGWAFFSKFDQQK